MDFFIKSDELLIIIFQKIIMILRILMVFACMAVVSHAESSCIQTIINQTFTHDPAKDPIFQNSTYKGMGYDSNESKFYVP